MAIGHVPGGPSNPMIDKEHRVKVCQRTSTVIDEQYVRELELALFNFASLPGVRAVTRYFQRSGLAQGPREPRSYDAE